MNIQIKHGIPNHNFFIVAQPKRSYDEARIGTENKPIVTLTDPKNPENIISAELYDYWTISSEREFIEMDGFSFMAYGVSATVLKSQLMERYPELRQNFIIEYWLLRKI
jgi:hypothetical protein